VTLEIRAVRPEEHQETGRVTALAYQEFAAEETSPNADYLRRVADVATRSRHALVLAAFRDERVLGSVTIELTDRIPGGHPRPPLEPDQAHVRMLGVHPNARAQGVGRALMDAAVEQARQAGKRRITLETAVAMRAAQTLYESMGFRRGPDQVYEDGFRLRTYELPI
jgi:ribosomal protein S18 acetylase RimI-like enzyme